MSGDALTFIVVLVIAVIVMQVILGRNRAAKPWSGLHVTWRQATGPVWRELPYAWWYIGGHGLALVVLSAIMLRQGSESGGFLSAVGAGVLCAPAIAMLVLYGYLPPFDMAVYDGGIIRGRFVLAWNGFSHFRAGDAPEIVLYSARAPDIPRIVLRPPASQYGDVVARLKLPDHPLSDSD